MATYTEARELLDQIKQTWEQAKDAMERKADSATVTRLNDRIDQLETKLNRSPIKSPTDDVSAFSNDDARLMVKSVLAGGATYLPDETERNDALRLMRDIESKVTKNGKLDKKALLAGDDTLGGFLAPPEMANEIIKGVQLISPVRAYAGIRQTTRRSVMLPVRSGVFSAAWTPEAAARTETTGLAYSMEEVFATEMYALILVSNQDLEDSAFDLGQDIIQNAAEQFAKLEGTAFVNGDGLKKPEGFMNNSNIAADLSAGAGALDADSVISFVYNLKSDYARRATLMMNRKTLGVLRKFKDQQLRYLWEPNYQVGTPQTVLGIPVAEVPDMDDVGATKFPIAIGDFSRGYKIVDRVDMAVLKLQELYAAQGQVGFLIRKRVGGQVVLPEAIRKLKSNNS